MKHMKMRGDFLSQRSVKQTEGQNPIGRKRGKEEEEVEKERDRNVSHGQRKINKRSRQKWGDRVNLYPPSDDDNHT